ncbi:peptide-methionine (S)-S-oxide reductase [Cohnella luojiensis]|uniref:peptide-methionine (S)-S-oxide reductase n=1 Tax=Cohnella luojiensis TaxID=652876 RepID=UPI0014312387|nr:peptide-methionine (S)-S-oxide reductase [Cohnella luojiensis]
MEETFQKLDGVSNVYTGYTGGYNENPTYAQVVSKQTDHLESVEVHYNPNVIRYDELLRIFWRNVDPTDAGGQFGDRGSEYLSAIYYSNEQIELAEASSGRNSYLNKIWRLDK